MAAAIASESSFPDRKQEFIGYNQLVYGVACISGPLIGSFLYYIGGYQCPLFSLGSLYVIMILIMWPMAMKE